MKFRHRRLATALAGVSGAMTLGALSANAADVIADATGANIVVEITGSHIKGVLTEGALPVQTITREEITKSGAQTAYEILNNVSAVMSYGGLNEFVANRFAGSPGFAGVSLRGLGIDKTLILLDGRRIANYALGRGFPGVDLNSIPTAVLDRVEILKDGASAIYGSDAIGGVINFITRKDFSGAEIFGYYASPQDGGGQQTRATLTAGVGDLAKDKFNAWISFDYLDNKALFARDRQFAKTSYLPGLGVNRTARPSFPANVFIPGGGFKNPTDPTPNAPGMLSAVCLPPPSFPTIDEPHECRYDATPLNSIVEPSTRYNVFGRLFWQINPDLQMFGEGSYSRNQFTNIGAEAGTGTVPPNTAVLPASSPYYPTAWLQANYPAAVGQPLTLMYRNVEMGPLEHEPTSEQQRAVFGLKGAFKGWDYEAAFNYNRSKVSHSNTNGYLDGRLYYPLFNTGVVNPFGPNTPEVLAQMDATRLNGEIESATGTIQSLDLKASGNAVELAAGPLALALGGEYRKEDLAQWRDPVFATGNLVGITGQILTPSPADRTVGSLFAEADIPIVRSLDAQAAVRYDHYSDFGGTTNWKLALRWQPMREILFRGSWNTGFHAPSLLELYQPLFYPRGQLATGDPLRCPLPGTAADICNGTYLTQRGGNPALQPETSDQWSLGFVLEPVAGLSMTFDWFHIELQNLLSQRSENFLAAAMADPNSPYVVRGPSDDLYPDLPGPVLYWVGPTQNVDRKLVEGIDVDLTWRLPKSSFGLLTARLNGTYLTQYRQSLEDGSFPNIVGKRGDLGSGLGSVPRWKHVLTFDWTLGPWNATLIENYTHSYAEACRPADVSGCSTRKVAAYEVWDLSAGYTGFQNTTLRLGIKNLANRDPPVSNQQQTAHIGWDPSYADPRGRTFYGSVRYAFK